MVNPSLKKHRMSQSGTAEPNLTNPCYYCVKAWSEGNISAQFLCRFASGSLADIKDEESNKRYTVCHRCDSSNNNICVQIPENLINEHMPDLTKAWEAFLAQNAQDSVKRAKNKEIKERSMTLVLHIMQEVTRIPNDMCLHRGRAEFMDTGVKKPARDRSKAAIAASASSPDSPRKKRKVIVTDGGASRDELAREVAELKTRLEDMRVSRDNYKACLLEFERLGLPQRKNADYNAFLARKGFSRVAAANDKLVEGEPA